MFDTMKEQTPKLFLLAQIRKSRGLSLDKVAREVTTDPTNLSRIEKGQQTPKRHVARKLHSFYGGAVPLGAIYDPAYYAEHCRRD